MKIISLSNGEQNAGIYPHSSTHHSGGTDAISAEAIGAETVGTALAQIDAHRIEENPHPNMVNMVAANPFLEDYDDFLGFPLGVGHKLGWNAANSNGWGGIESGNRFPGACGVIILGINGPNPSTTDYSHFRLGNFPFIPQSSEGYSVMEFWGKIGLNPVNQTELSWSSRFGLLDTGNGLGTNSSILISAEYDGGYNWVAIWKSGPGKAVERQVITPVTGDLNTKMFWLKLKIDITNNKIYFSVDDIEIEVSIPAADWLFGAMSLIFYISRLSSSTPGRMMWLDKFLFRKSLQPN